MPTIKNRFASLFVLSLIIAILFGFAARPALAQERRVELAPNGSVANPFPFLQATGLVGEQTAVIASATATGNTTLYTIPKGAANDPAFVGGLPQPTTYATVYFYVTSIQVETTQATGVSAGAVFRVGTSTSDTAILASTTLANSAAAGGFQNFPVAAGTVLKTGDVLILKITTGATATSQALKVHVVGYYQ